MLRKNQKSLDLALYVVTDRELSKGRTVEKVVEQALAGGATAIQYREKALPFRVMLAECTALKRLTKEAQALFIINDRVDLVLACDADGVHLGQDDMPLEIARRLMGRDKIIGASVQSVGEARIATGEGADYLGVSGVFYTATKTDVGAVLGLETVAAIAKTTDLPVVGIGGISASNAAEVVKAGAQGVAVVSAVVSSEDIAQACRVLRVEVARGKGGK